MNDQAISIIIWVIIGLVAGWLASLIIGGASSLIGYLVAGLVGSIVGGFLARQFNIRPNFGSPLAEQMVISFVGAVVVLILVRIIN